VEERRLRGGGIEQGWVGVLSEKALRNWGAKRGIGQRGEDEESCFLSKRS